MKDEINTISKFPISKKQEQQGKVDRIGNMFAELEDFLLTTEIEPPFNQQAMDKLQEALWAIEEALKIIE